METGSSGGVIRVATYNIHRCRGLDRRVSVARIAEVIERLEADVVAVQEIRRGMRESDPESDQVAFLADALGYHVAFGANKLRWGAPYGNATFSRFPIVFEQNYDLTLRGHERRGCLRADLRPPGRRVHVYNVHLSTRYFARPRQARHLLSDLVVNHPAVKGPRIVVGDFNEWTRGVATRLMGEHFESVDLRLLGRRRTYPGLFPVLHLDHFYFDPALRLRSFRLHRSRLALLASDHLPLVAEFEVPLLSP